MICYCFVIPRGLVHLSSVHHQVTREYNRVSITKLFSHKVTNSCPISFSPEGTFNYYTFSGYQKNKFVCMYVDS